MFEELLTSDKYSSFQIGMYYLGAICWFLSYVVVLRRAFKLKFIEFPIMAVSANVIWEFIWGFLFELDFGGNYLLTLWRMGFGLDVLIFYTVLKYGKIQVSTPQITKYYVPIMLFASLCSGVLIYTYKVSGYDLPMGINSGMILNVMMSALAILLIWQLQDKEFSFWAGFLRFLGTDVFFFIYIVSVYPTLSFPVAMCVICFILDFYYLYLTIRRKKELAQTTR